MISLEEFWHGWLIVLALTFVGGRMFARWLRAWGFRWTWGLVGFGLTFVLFAVPVLANGVAGASVVACWTGARWHRSDLAQGRDLAEMAVGGWGRRGL
jgi:hypothetical protein